VGRAFLIVTTLPVSMEFDNGGVICIGHDHERIFIRRKIYVIHQKKSLYGSAHGDIWRVCLE
jgi:hypothetical protein